MPFPKTCAGALDTMQNMSTMGSWYTEKASVHALDALDHWNLAQDHAAIEDLISASLDLHEGVGYLAYNYSPWDGDACIPWYLTNCISAPDINMEAIINAMLIATPMEIEYFIGLADAFRQSMWNRPFNREFFAALARGFMEWE